VVAACGVRVLAKDLDKAMAGLPLFVVRDDNEREQRVQHIEQMIRSALNEIQLKEQGVYVQASTFGSLEALLKLLEASKIPVRRRYSFIDRCTQ
jgi:translation initiation factor 5B